MHKEELNKLRREKDERNATAHPLQKVSIDKVKEAKMNFKTTFTNKGLTCDTEVSWTVGIELPETTFKQQTRTNEL